MSHISYDPDEAPKMTDDVNKALLMGYKRIDVFIRGDNRRVAVVAVGDFLPRAGETIVTENDELLRVSCVRYRLKTIDGATVVVPMIFATAAKR